MEKEFKNDLDEKLWEVRYASDVSGETERLVVDGRLIFIAYHSPYVGYYTGEIKNDKVREKFFFENMTSEERKQALETKTTQMFKDFIGWATVQSMQHGDKINIDKIISAEENVGSVYIDDEDGKAFWISASECE